MIELGLLVALGTLAVGFGAAFALRLLPTVRLQLIGLALVAVLVPLAAVFVSGLVMFHMGDDVQILAVAAAAASAAVGAALFLASSISSRVERLRRASVDLARGELGSRAPEQGPRELAELGASFNEMASNIERLFDARRQLVAWASHDLRTPIASMQAMIEALEDGLAEPEQYLPALRDQARRLAALVDDLFELARIDAGLLELELREAPLSDVVASCLRGLEAEARAKHVRLEASVAESATAICAPETVERVLFNLLTNALRHTPSDGSVAVLVEPDLRRGAGDRGGHRRGVAGRGAATGVRSVLSWRPGAVGREGGRRPRAGDRPGARRGAGRQDLGRARARRRRARLLHAPGGS